MPAPKKPQPAPRGKSKTPAERGEEAAVIQRQLKQDAADRRAAAGKKPKSAGDADTR
jgi:hypothetical protein